MEEVEGRTVPRAFGRWTASLTLCLMLLGCPESGPTPEEQAKAAREAAFKQRVEQAETLLSEAGKLAAGGKPDEAWPLWTEARNLVGETPDLSRTRDIIRAAEAKIERDLEHKRVVALIGRDSTAKSEPDRLTALAAIATEVKAFLDRYPEASDGEELRASLEYAEQELALVHAYSDALTEADGHMTAGRMKECIAACSRALAALPRPQARELRDRALEKLTPEGMVLIPGGRYLKGRDRDPAVLGPFYMDRTEVTNAQYQAFCAATDREMPQHFIGGKPPAGKEQCPVTYITLEDALAFARHAGKRLPNEDEWERAARGTEGLPYPWGPEWDPGKGHFGGGGTVPVGSKPLDRSPDGVLDLGGNVTEMTLPSGAPADGDAGPILKGGHWAGELHPEYALTFERYAADRNHADSGTGFRCVKSALD